MNRPAKIFLKVVLISLGFLLLAYAGLVTYATYTARAAVREASLDVAGQVTGNPQGTLTVVEFVDYRCHYCPVMNATLEEALRDEPEVKVIIRPVGWVDDLSKPIANFVLATAAQGKMTELHSRLMSLSALPDLETAKTIAASIGIDVAKAEEAANSKEIADAVATNEEYVANSGLMGVPSLIIGGYRYQPDEEGMKSVNGLRMKFADAIERQTKESEK